MAWPEQPIDWLDVYRTMEREIKVEQANNAALRARCERLRRVAVGWQQWVDTSEAEYLNRIYDIADQLEPGDLADDLGASDD